MTPTMYCPRCAREFTRETSYCRTCGLELDGVSALVIGEAETAPEVRSRPNFRLMQTGIALFIFGTVLGLLYGALRGFELFPEQYGKLVFMLFIAAGMLCLGLGFVFPKKYYVKRQRNATSEKLPVTLDTDKLDQLPPADRNIDIKQPASVTERTTRSLR